MKTLNLTNQNIYNIADNKTKKMLNTYVEELKGQGLLTGIFGILATNIHKRTRVKNSEILELFIYGAYIEEQGKLDKYEKQIIKEDMNYYYQQGQEEVIKAQKKKKEASIIPDAIFLALLDMQSANGFNLKQNIQATIQYNAQQLYKQALIYIQQQKELEIENKEFQKIINQQNNNKLCINGEKISGMMDNQLIGLNNMAKVEGILQENNSARVKFIAVEDNSTTPMCHSLNGQIFYINKENEFNRYYGETKSDLRIQRIKCFGLVQGLNLPPISHHIHWCRSTITYQVPLVEKAKKIDYNIANYIRKNNYTNNKILDKEIRKAIKLLPKHIKELLKDTKFYIANNNSYYDRNKDEIHLMKDADKHEVLHEIGHMIETKLDILHNQKYIEIQNKGLENINPIMDINKIEGYGEHDFIINTGKFISEYQRIVYEYDIDKNERLNFLDYTFNTKTLGEYFSEGFRCYFESNKLLREKDIDLYNYIKEILK